MTRAIAALAALAAGFLLAAPAWAIDTEITVRVLSKGAKFVGTSMGGAGVTIRDADTGELLAQGTTEGSTGDTERIMKQAHGREGVLSSAGAAKYTAVLDIDAPRRIEVAATGPLGQPQSANRVSVTQWVVPGKHVTGGDAFLLELPGFVVDVLEPAAHVRLGAAPQVVTLRANVTMMCGCPITPGGLWDAESYEVAALVKHDGARYGGLALTYAGTPSQFAGKLTLKEPGAYEAIVYAYDPANGNTGLDRTTFIVTK